MFLLLYHGQEVIIFSNGCLDLSANTSLVNELGPCTRRPVTFDSISSQRRIILFSNSADGSTSHRHNKYGYDKRQFYFISDPKGILALQIDLIW